MSERIVHDYKVCEVCVWAGGRGGGFTSFVFVPSLAQFLEFTVLKWIEHQKFGLKIHLPKHVAPEIVLLARDLK